jgi:23S rRNA (cytosine1962-C5)-methyltransferase
MHTSAEIWLKALGRRRELIARARTQAFRVLSGEFDGLPGVYVDVYGAGAVMNVYEGRTPPGFDVRHASTGALDALRGLGVRGVYVKPFVRDRSRLGGELPAGVSERDPVAAGGAGESVGEDEGGRCVVREGEILLEIRLWDGLSTGLFLDQRENRGWVHSVAPGKRVLNTFSYTCAFSVAAAVGGASEVTSVDVSGRYIDWGKRNFELNGIDPGRHRFAKMDTFEFFAYARRKGLKYDLIILDPPSFGSGNKKKGIRAWSAVDGYARLVGEATTLLDRGGKLLASTNNAELCAPGRLEREVVKGYGRKPRWLRLPDPGDDIRPERGRVAWRGLET